MTKLLSLIDAKVLNSNTNGSAVSLPSQEVSTRRGYQFWVSIGSLVGTNPKVTVKLQESETGTANWTDVPDAVFTDLATMGFYSKYIVVPTQPYVRAVVTLSGTAPESGTAVGLLSWALRE